MQPVQHGKRGETGGLEVRHCDAPETEQFIRQLQISMKSLVIIHDALYPVSGMHFYIIPEETYEVTGRFNCTALQ